MKYSYCRLDEVANVVSGSTPSTIKKEYYGGRILWATPKDLSRLDDVYIEDTEKKITEEGYKSCSTALLPAGTVLFSSRAPIGLIAIAKRDICTNQGFKNFVCDKSKIYPEFLYYCLRYYRPMIQGLGRGATFSEVSKELISSFKIPVPSIERQKSIAGILIKSEQLIKKRRQTLRLADEFLKFVFLDMFGDPLSNAKKWPIRKLGKILDVRDGTHDSPKYIREGVPLVTSKNLKNGEIDFTNISYISNEDQQKIDKRSFVNDGDILYGMIGTIGSPVIVKKDREFCIKNVALFKFGGCEMERYFFRILMSDDFMTKKLLGTKRGGTQKFVSLNMLRSFEIPVPPIFQQQKFANIVQKVERLKEKQKQSETELQNLFNSLMQQVFKGNL